MVDTRVDVPDIGTVGVIFKLLTLCSVAGLRAAEATEMEETLDLKTLVTAAHCVTSFASHQLPFTAVAWEPHLPLCWKRAAFGSVPVTD